MFQGESFVRALFVEQAQMSQGRSPPIIEIALDERFTSAQLNAITEKLAKAMDLNGEQPVPGRL